MTTEVIGYSRKEIIELMLSNGIHCSVDRFVALAMEIQGKAVEAAGQDKTDGGMKCGLTMP